MLPRNVRLSIVVAQLVTIATLMRSIAFDRWITVLASALLLVGASAALRNRAWGVALMFAQAVAFPVAVLIGLAPPWFALVGAAGMLPFVLTAPGFVERDRGATRLLAALAVAGGTLGALAWKQFAWSVFEAFPSLMPSLHPHHGFIVAAVAALGIATAVKNRHLVDTDAGADAGVNANANAGAETDAPSRLRIAEPARIAPLEEDDGDDGEERYEPKQEVLRRRMRG